MVSVIGYAYRTSLVLIVKVVSGLCVVCEGVEWVETLPGAKEWWR